MQLDFLTTLQSVLVLFLLIVIGFIAGRSKLISPQGQRDITNLVLYITMPATIFSALQMDFNLERISRAATIIGIVTISYVFMFGIGLLLSKHRGLGLELAQQDVFRAALLLSNTAFMGYPIVSSLLGEEALFFAAIGTGFIFEILTWSLGNYLMGRRGSNSGNFNWRKIVFSPGILSIILGLFFFVSGWSVPEPAHSVIRMLRPATSPLAMIVVGLIFSRGNIRDTFTNKLLYLQAAFKLLVIPLTILFCLKLLGFTGYELIIPTIMLGMPTASIVAMFAQNYENNPGLASQMVFMSTLLSVITIPIITLFF